MKQVERGIGPVVVIITVFVLLFSAAYTFGETKQTSGEKSFGTLHYICLGSFTVPANAAQYQLELAASGVETITENVRVRGRWFTRVLYRNSFLEEMRAQTALDTLLDNRVIRANNIRDLWVRSSLGPLEDDPVFAEQPAPASTPQLTSTPQPAPSPSTTKAPPPSSAGTTQVQPDPDEGSEMVQASAAPDVSSDAARAPAAPDVSSDAAQASADLDGSPYRTIHPEGYANCIFAAEPIQLGREDEYDLKERFVYPEPVYARCYLPGPIGPIEGENFWHEIWIDGKLKGRTFFKEPPEPSWDQIQIWITEDEYSSRMEELGPGEHTIIIWVMKNEFQGERAVADVNAAGEITAEMKEIWVPVRLSKGKFTYVVP